MSVIANRADSTAGVEAPSILYDFRLSSTVLRDTIYRMHGGLKIRMCYVTSWANKKRIFSPRGEKISCRKRGIIGGKNSFGGYLFEVELTEPPYALMSDCIDYCELVIHLISQIVL